jgi:hypothetical protein
VSSCPIASVYAAPPPPLTPERGTKGAEPPTQPPIVELPGCEPPNPPSMAALKSLAPSAALPLAFAAAAWHAPTLILTLAHSRSPVSHSHSSVRSISHTNRYPHTHTLCRTVPLFVLSVPDALCHHAAARGGRLASRRGVWRAGGGARTAALSTIPAFCVRARPCPAACLGGSLAARGACCWSQTDVCWNLC